MVGEKLPENQYAKRSIKETNQTGFREKIYKLRLRAWLPVWSLSQKHQNILAKSISILLDKQMTPY